MSPKSAARLAGLLYLVVIAGGLFAELGMRGQVMVPGDAAATAANILEHERLFPYILLPCLVGELVFALWLVARGVTLDRWAAFGSGSSQ